LSPPWMEMLNYTVTEAQRLDLGIDLTTGTGWCFGGPHVTDAEANASVVVKTFDAAVGRPMHTDILPASVQAIMAFSPNGASMDLTAILKADGRIDWTPPADGWRIYVVTQRPSGQKVKRAAPGGEGWMLNPFYAEAMRHYLEWFDGAFARHSGLRPR